MGTAFFTLWICAALFGGDLERLPNPVIERVRGPIREAWIGGGLAKSAPRIIYANTLLSGYYMVGEAGMEWIDWGEIVSNGDHDTVTGLSLGYATTRPSTSVRFRVYDGYTGHCTERGTPLLDLSLTGLPGSPGGGLGLGGLGWIVSLDLGAAGECFYKSEGRLGYSYSFPNADSGPLFARGGAGQDNQVDWVLPPGVLCGTLGSGRRPPPPAFWHGFYAVFLGHDGNDTYGVGCGGLAGLALEGTACAGGSVRLTASGRSGGLAALALGVQFGPGIGGPIGQCMLDVFPMVPIIILGRFSSAPLVLSFDLGLPPSGVVCAQLIATQPATGSIHLSPTEILNVP